MRLPSSTLSVTAAVALVLTCASGATAGTRASAPAGGGLAALDVDVNLASATVHANAAEIPIALDPSLLPDGADVIVEAISLGGGRNIVHVRVPVRGSEPGGPAWEALLSAGRRAPVFSGMTGLSHGDPGERTGTAIRVEASETRGGASRVWVGDIHEDLRICGQTETLIGARALDPLSLELRPSAPPSLSDAEQASAIRLTATDRGAVFDAPLGKLLAAHGSSVVDSFGLEVTDGDAHTVWRPKGPAGGQGAFVILAAPKAVPITRMQFSVSAPDAVRVGAAPRVFFLVTGERSYRVALPEAAAHKPGEVSEVVFPEPIETSCMTLVLDSSSPSGPETGVAEIAAFSDFDVPGATLDAVAEKLSGPRSAAAVQVLERSGPPGLAAVEKAYAGLDARGRALTVDVAATSERCEDAGPLLTRALCEKDGEASRRALEKLQRCPRAASALARAVREDPGSRSCVAPILATLSPGDALEPIADALGDASATDSSTRATLRAAFGGALGQVGQGRLAPLLSDPNRSVSGRLELLRAAEDRAVEAASSADALVAELMQATSSMRVRYLVLGPLAALSRAGDLAARGRLVDAVARDADWPVRARAAELSGGLVEAVAPLVSALRDPEPRVRAAALSALATARSPEAVQAAVRILGGDDWSFVKAQAVSLLARAPASSEVDDALGAGLTDPLVSVRGSVLVALARRHATRWHQAIRDRLDDDAEDIHLRAAAASALGAICDVSSTDRLTDLAHGLASGGSREDAPVGLGALIGLAGLHPRDLQQRVAPLLAQSAPAWARAAAQRALSARGVCP